MKFIALVNPGLETVCQQEIKELLKIKSVIHAHALEFETSPESALCFINHTQSARRVLLLLDICSLPEESKFNEVDWNELISSGLSFKAEIENVSGNENRMSIAKKVVGNVFRAVEKQGISISIDLKKPDVTLVVYFNEKQYVLGIDLSGIELNARHYRVFTHSASLKGDLAYFFIRKSGFNPGKNILIGCGKDGVMGIEAALYAHSVPVLYNQHHSYQKIPLFKDIKVPALHITPAETTIAITDENQRNIIAARKNSSIAGVRKFINIQQMYLDEMSSAFGKESFDQAIFQLTVKDEDKINEVYHQAAYLLKPKGTLMLITRKNLDFPAPSGFLLSGKEEIGRGENIYRLLILKKKA